MAIARAAARLAILSLFSTMLFLVTGEIALRVFYRDAGRRTLGGPGGEQFDHLEIRNNQRGRLDLGARRPGVPRVMVIGDSITYGLGVHHWRDTWPEVLARTYERNREPIEMAVFALPGRDIPQHVEELAYWGRRVQPDALIYQWYVNDIEAIYHRPQETVGWQQWRSHGWLRAHSYLYFFVDHVLAGRLRSGAYVDYLVHDFQPGTVEWTEFERGFHDFAILARAVAKTRVLMLYPQVPYRERYPLQPLHDRMRAIAGAHTLAIPPAAWVRAAGTLTPDDSAPWKQVVAIPSGYTGLVADTKEYLLAPGALDATLTFSIASGGTHPARVGTFEWVDAASNVAFFSQELNATGAGGLQTIAVHAVHRGEGLRRVRCRIRSSGQVAWRLAGVGVSVDYGMTVVDLSSALNGFNTHASLFDSHPNEAAHRVMAEHAYAALHQVTKN